MSTRAALAATRESFRKLGRGQVHLKYHRQLPVALVQLDNPAKHNALSGRMMAELADCVDQLDQHQDKLAAVILTGTGSSFCTGFDLDVASEHVFDPASGRAMATLMHDSLTRLRELPLVSFAAVEGYAIGGGAELTTTTDFRIVTHSTQIRFVQLRMGAAPGWGGGYRLTRLLGPTKSLQLFLSCKKLDGDAAVRWGLAQSACPAGHALHAALDTITSYLGVPLPTDHQPTSSDRVPARPPVSLAHGSRTSSGAAELGTSTALSVEDEAGDAARGVWGQFVAMTEPVGLEAYDGHSLKSVRAIKAAVVAGDRAVREKALEVEREAFVTCWGSEENLKALERAAATAAGKKRK
ncbi:hypothetical protein AMAG_06425 [Allomyces macrogynus ATCC 38327]|uniref:Enoyl-CoA hydratase/isomerase n=2 Tax=Allomyces macrogynus (strain ATCC 38327) TaxID=578462 RepID=A0A0L0SGH1_ALLM3|nr:hypothetical protein AMAG_06425 [Allomyces macrogynus ATCC 38327]|eukprot:KNE61613.1 hypothetical protein AMAG_06425 [Allomyces macrogynus ATCC 38327]